MIVTHVEESSTEINYPVLMKNRGNNMIVFFISPETGILLNKGNSETKDNLGTLSTNWAEADDPTQWTKFRGSIEITND